MTQERTTGGRFKNSGSGTVEVVNFLGSSIVPGYVYSVSRKYVDSVMADFGITDPDDPSVETDRGPAFVNSLNKLIGISNSGSLIRLVPYIGDTHYACDHCALKGCLGLCQITECGDFAVGSTSYYIAEIVK